MSQFASSSVVRRLQRERNSAFVNNRRAIIGEIVGVIRYGSCHPSNSILAHAVFASVSEDCGIKETAESRHVVIRLLFVRYMFPNRMAAKRKWKFYFQAKNHGKARIIVMCSVYSSKSYY